MKRKWVVAAALALGCQEAFAAFNCVQIQYSPNREVIQVDQLSWTANVGMAPPVMPNRIADAWTVEFACAANGAELSWIAARFTGLRMRGQATNGRTIVWEGDDAIFIVENL